MNSLLDYFTTRDKGHSHKPDIFYNESFFKVLNQFLQEDWNAWFIPFLSGNTISWEFQLIYTQITLKLVTKATSILYISRCWLIEGRWILCVVCSGVWFSHYTHAHTIQRLLSGPRPVGCSVKSSNRPLATTHQVCVGLLVRPQWNITQSKRISFSHV